MTYTKHVALALLLSLSLINVGHAQSEDDDPLAGFDDLFDAIEAIEEFEEAEGAEESAGTESETSPPAVEESTTPATETSAETSTETVTETEALPEGKTIGNRLLLKDIPEGKEDHLLYTIPGAIDYRGMTFLRIDSSKFFNKFQRCDTAETDKTYNTLARLKISQGAPLECREAMKYQFLPYKTFRATR